MKHGLNTDNVNRNSNHQKRQMPTARVGVGVRRSSKASDIQSLDKNRLQIFLCLLTSALCFLSAGCSVTSGRRSPDGSLTVTNYRLLWSSEAVDFSTSDIRPPTSDFSKFTARLKIGKSATDDEAVAAVVAGVVKGITQP